MFNLAKSMKSLAVSGLLLSLACCTVMDSRETAGQYVDDSTISAKVKEAFLADSKVNSTQVSVETMQGVVQLSGFVDSSDTEARAVRLAQQVKGVKSVKDSIIVRSK